MSADGARPSGDLRSTSQEGLELDPAEQDSSDNVPVAEMEIDTASLFEQALGQTRMAITIVDPHRPDSPIIFANEAFTELTGYERNYAVGRNCRFLQGPETALEAVDELRAALKAEEVKVVEMLNYRRDGSTFWNALHVGPIYDDAGRLTHYYGSQWDITDLVEKRARIALQAEVAEELQHRTRNLFGVMSSIVTLSARGETSVESVTNKIRNRIVALGHAHTISISEGRTSGVAADLYDLVAAILRPYQTTGRDAVIVSGPIVEMPRTAVTPVGLMLHELATNALKYGALSNSGGTVTVAWSRQDDRLRLTWTEEGGPAVKEPESAGTGTRMMEGVLRTIGADIDYDWRPEGLSVTIDMEMKR